MPNTAPSATALRAFHTRLHAWYRANGRRDLPWRSTRDAYAIYVSEVMLQQTQVKTVLERYYHPFIKRFPSLCALARAPQQEVMKAWQGLGYYSRAVNLHQTAQQVKRLPQTVEELMELPGIGRNTAHAIAAFAYHQPVAVLEANVKRVIHRIFALPEANSTTLWEKAEALLNHDNPFDYNQAMMDLGALVCTPKSPDCRACPASDLCAGKANPLAYPARKAAKAVPTRTRWMMVVESADGRFYLERRTKRFLGGLYGFVQTEPGSPEADIDGARLSIKNTNLIGRVTHTYSHFRLEAEVRHTKLRSKKPNWLSCKQISALPLSRADEKVLALIRALPKPARRAASNAARNNRPRSRQSSQR